MEEVKRGSDRRDEEGRRAEDRRKTNLSVENEHRTGSRREGFRRIPADDRRSNV
jgi:hypothetical protein